MNKLKSLVREYLNILRILIKKIEMRLARKLKIMSESPSKKTSIMKH